MNVATMTTAASAVLAALALAPASATAGGFSTVGLTSPPPEEIETEQAWEARFTVLAHGRTPLDHLEPVVRIERADGGAARSFGATKTDRPGAYRARVVFPAEGRWEIEVAEHDALAGTPVAGHSFGAVDVGSAAASSGAAHPGPSVPAALAIAVALGLLVGGGAWLVQAKPAPRRSAADAG